MISIIVYHHLMGLFLNFSKQHQKLRYRVQYLLSYHSSRAKEKIILGQVAVPLVDLSAPTDYWLCLYSTNNHLGDLRVKVKYTEEVVLSLEQYKDLLEVCAYRPFISTIHDLTFPLLLATAIARFGGCSHPRRSCETEYT